MAIKKILTRNANSLSESEYFSKIRSSLRNAFRYWKPGIIALNKASRKYQGANKRAKTEYQCSSCKEWFLRKDIEIDHITPCGSLKTYDDIVPFIKNLTQEDSNLYQILCSKSCHLSKTINERRNKTTHN